MKRLVALLLALMMLGCMSCSSAAQEKVVLHLTRAVFNLPASDPAQVKKVEDAINSYIADKLNVEIRLNEIGSDIYPTAANDLLRNQEVNILWTGSWEPIIGTNDLVAKKMIYDITDLLPGTMLYKSMSSTLWDTTTYSERNYFIPVYKDNVEGYDFMFRGDLADKYGWNISRVSRLADLEPMLEDAKAEGLKYPFLTQRNAMFYRWYMDRFDFFTADARSNFVAIDRETDEVIDTILTPEYAEFCKLMSRWAEKAYISTDEVNKLTTDTTVMSQDWGISWWTDVPVNMEASARYGQRVLLKTATERYAHRTSSLGSCYCVTAWSTPEQAKAAVDFLGLLFTDKKLADLYTFGIEGEDFEYTKAEGQSIWHVTQHSDKYNHSMWESASAMIVTPMDNEPDDKANLYIDFNGGANTTCSSDFRFDRKPVTRAYRDCQLLFDKYGFALENGGIPEDQVDEVIEKYQYALNQAGYRYVLMTFRGQYRRWKEEIGQLGQ